MLSAEIPDGVQSYMSRLQKICDECPDFGWVNKKLLKKTFSITVVASIFCSLLTDDYSDNKHKQKVQKLAEKEFMRRFDLPQEECAIIVYQAKIGMELWLKVLTGINDLDGYGELMVANLFWDIYDCLADISHKTPSKLIAEIEVLNSSLGIRAFTYREGYSYSLLLNAKFNEAMMLNADTLSEVGRL